MSLITTFMSDKATGIRPKIGRDAQLGQTQDFTAGASGVTTLFSDVACSYQEASARTQMYYNQRNATVSNEVYFGCQVQIEPNDQLTVTRCKLGDTVKLVVVGEVEPITLGSQWVWKVACERIRQPRPTSEQVS